MSNMLCQETSLSTVFKVKLFSYFFLDFHGLQNVLHASSSFDIIFENSGWPTVVILFLLSSNLAFRPLAFLPWPLEQWQALTHILTCAHTHFHVCLCTPAKSRKHLLLDKIVFVLSLIFMLSFRRKLFKEESRKISKLDKVSKLEKIKIMFFLFLITVKYVV